MLVDPVEQLDLDSVAGSACTVVEVDFTGVVNGSYLIFAPRDLLAVLATNVLGLDEEPTPESCEDAFREMGNVLSGNLLTEMFGEDTVFDISLPRVRDTNGGDREQLERNKQRTFNLCADGVPVAVTFWAQEGQ